MKCFWSSVALMAAILCAPAHCQKHCHNVLEDQGTITEVSGNGDNCSPKSFLFSVNYMGQVTVVVLQSGDQLTSSSSPVTCILILYEYEAESGTATEMVVSDVVKGMCYVLRGLEENKTYIVEMSTTVANNIESIAHCCAIIRAQTFGKEYGDEPNNVYDNTTFFSKNNSKAITTQEMCENLDLQPTTSDVSLSSMKPLSSHKYTSSFSTGFSKRIPDLTVTLSNISNQVTLVSSAAHTPTITTEALIDGINPFTTTSPTASMDLFPSTSKWIPPISAKDELSSFISQSILHTKSMDLSPSISQPIPPTKQMELSPSISQSIPHLRNMELSLPISQPNPPTNVMKPFQSVSMLIPPTNAGTLGSATIIGVALGGFTFIVTFVVVSCVIGICCHCQRKRKSSHGISADRKLMAGVVMYKTPVNILTGANAIENPTAYATPVRMSYIKQITSVQTNEGSALTDSQLQDYEQNSSSALEIVESQMYETALAINNHNPSRSEAQVYEEPKDSLLQYQQTQVAHKAMQQPYEVPVCTTSHEDQATLQHQYQTIKPYASLPLSSTMKRQTKKPPTYTSLFHGTLIAPQTYTAIKHTPSSGLYSSLSDCTEPAINTTKTTPPDSHQYFVLDRGHFAEEQSTGRDPLYFELENGSLGIAPSNVGDIENAYLENEQKDGRERVYFELEQNGNVVTVVRSEEDLPRPDEHAYFVLERK